MKLKYINWSTSIFPGFYESELYNCDTLFNITENCKYDDEIKDDEYYDCAVITRGEDIDFAKAHHLYKKYRYADISGEVFEDYKISNIEAVDDEDEPQYILVRLG